MMRKVFRRAQALVALASFVVIAGCSGSEVPSAPTPVIPATAPPDPVAPTSVTSVAPSAPIQSDVAQLLTVSGLGFRPGLALAVIAPSGTSVTIASADIRDLLPTSFQASVVLSEAGVYSLVVRQMDGEVSAPFRLAVGDVPAVEPTIESVTPSETPPDAGAQVLTLTGRHFNSALVVQVVDPDSLLTQLNRSNTMNWTDSVIQFSVMLNRVGDYQISLWDELGPVSNVVVVRVR